MILEMRVSIVILILTLSISVVRAQHVLPDSKATYHYKNNLSEIISFQVEQRRELPIGDTLFTFYKSFEDTLALGNLRGGIFSTGHPLGDSLIKKVDGSWSSRLYKTMNLTWWFDSSDTTNWIVHQSATDTLRCSFIGKSTIQHFSQPILVSVYQLKATGPKLGALNNQEIIISTYGILKSPDFRVPGKNRTLYLTGIQSDNLNIGLQLHSSTFGSYHVGDTLVFLHSDPEMRGYIIYSLISKISETVLQEVWSVNKITIELDDSAAYLTAYSTPNITLTLDKVPMSARRVINQAASTHFRLKDGLAPNQNPSPHTGLLKLISYNGGETYYFLACTGGYFLPTPSYQRTWTSNWGLTKIIDVEPVRNLNSPNAQCIGIRNDTLVYSRINGIAKGTYPALQPSSNLNYLLYDPIKVFPNPVENILKVYTKTAGTTSLKIINLQGLVMYTDSFETTYAVNVEFLNPGLYILQITDEDGTVRIKRFLKL